MAAPKASLTITLSLLQVGLSNSTHTSTAAPALTQHFSPSVFTYAASTTFRTSLYDLPTGTYSITTVLSGLAAHKYSVYYANTASTGTKLM
ncbi:hypothetical protein B484DRAFT_411117 [Ochromonadaceae sp. CCMP2298]|nr:hypothetical protein B484DRAFT_411117 [Ochromonadaceae sp. CCMP2298]